MKTKWIAPPSVRLLTDAIAAAASEGNEERVLALLRVKDREVKRQYWEWVWAKYQQEDDVFLEDLTQ